MVDILLFMFIFLFGLPIPVFAFINFHNRLFMITLTDGNRRKFPVIKHAIGKERKSV